MCVQPSFLRLDEVLERHGHSERKRSTRGKVGGGGGGLVRKEKKKKLKCCCVRLDDR